MNDIGVFLFPQAGPETEKAWIDAALDQKLGVIVGGRMTHPGYVISNGGFISDEGAVEMYLIAAERGVRDFVVPGNQPDFIATLGEDLAHYGDITFYAPGFVTQGGSISHAAKAAGQRWHAIVGRGIYQADNMHQAAKELSSQIV